MTVDLLQIVKEQLDEKFSNATTSSEMMYNFPVFTVDSNKIVPILSFFKTDKILNFSFLTDLTGYQTPNQQELVVVYHLHNLLNNYRIRIKAVLPISAPNIQSITTLWPAANWMERETFDFFGIIFDGHPNLKRILNVDEMTIFPLRKEFPLEDQERTDKDNAMFGR